MADSVSIITTLTVPDPVATAQVRLDEFWKPGAIGNGRIWVTGSALTAINGIECNVNNLGWVRVKDALAINDDFGFYITGNEPSDWGTTLITEFSQPTGTYFVCSQVTEKPTIVTANSENYTEVANVGALAARTWFWDEVASTFYLRTSTDVIPTAESAKAIIDPVFEQGHNYNVQLRVVDTLDVTSLLREEQFTWPYQVRNYVDRYLRNLLPTYAQNDPYLRKMYIVYAKQAADYYSMIDDTIAQLLVDYSTWGLPLWESQLGVPGIPSLTVITRRDLLKASRVTDSTRAGFFATILSVVPGVTITETYDTYRVDIKLSGVPDVGLRRALEAIIQQKKPVGIKVVVSYGQFIAGVSLAGDSL